MMPRIVAHHNYVIPQTCGVSYVGSFRQLVHPHDAVRDIKTIITPAGCDWVIAGFTDARPEYKEAYEQLCKRWKVVYQSPVRMNRRSGNRFFFCIFDTRK